MDFEGLTRRELQALCKKNKIPANITNVAMIDALKALETVEGVEEILEPSQSETAQSSIESPGKVEVTSPLVPRTGGRTTTRRNVAKKEPETSQAMAKTQRTTRKTVAKDADETKLDATETPAVARTTKRRAPDTLVCRKMESQLNECVDEENKDVVLVTPAPSGVTSRRRKGVVKEESLASRIYSTRRSVRLAEKNVEVSDQVVNENSDLVNKELFTKDGGETVEMNPKEGSDDLDEMSGITGSDATMEESLEGKDETKVISAEEQHMQIGEEHSLITTTNKENLDGKDDTTMEENLEGNDESEYVSAEEQQMQFGEESILTTTIIDEENLEGKDESEVLSAQEHDMLIGDETELVITTVVKEETSYSFEVGQKLVEVTYNNLENEQACFDFETEASERFLVMPLSDEGLQDADTYVTEIASERTEYLNATKACDCENVVLESEVGLLVDKSGDVYQVKNDDPSLDVLTNKEDEAKIEPNVEPTCLTVVSDNKENNIGTESKLVFTEERVTISKKTAENVTTTRLDELSLRKLCKMVKELEISKKLPKDKNGNKAALGRPALRELPENHLVDQTQN